MVAIINIIIIAFLGIKISDFYEEIENIQNKSVYADSLIVGLQRIIDNIEIIIKLFTKCSI